MYASCWKKYCCINSQSDINKCSPVLFYSVTAYENMSIWVRQPSQFCRHLLFYIHVHIHTQKYTHAHTWKHTHMHILMHRNLQNFSVSSLNCWQCQIRAANRAAMALSTLLPPIVMAILALFNSWHLKLNKENNLVNELNSVNKITF